MPEPVAVAPRDHSESLDKTNGMFIANTLQGDLPVVLSFLLVQWFVLAGFCRYLHYFGGIF